MVVDSIMAFAGNIAGDEESLTDEQKMEQAKNKTSKQAGIATRGVDGKKIVQARSKAVQVIEEYLAIDANFKKANKDKMAATKKHDDYAQLMDQLSQMKASQLQNPQVLSLIKANHPEINTDIIFESVNKWKKMKRYFGRIPSGQKISEEDRAKANEIGMQPEKYQNVLLGGIKGLFDIYKNAAVATGTADPTGRFGGVAAADAIRKKAAATKAEQIQQDFENKLKTDAAKLNKDIFEHTQGEDANQNMLEIIKLNTQLGSKAVEVINNVMSNTVHEDKPLEDQIKIAIGIMKASGFDASYLKMIDQENFYNTRFGTMFKEQQEGNMVDEKGDIYKFDDIKQAELDTLMKEKDTLDKQINAAESAQTKAALIKQRDKVNKKIAKWNKKEARSQEKLDIRRDKDFIKDYEENYLNTNKASKEDRAKYQDLKYKHSSFLSTLNLGGAVSSAIHDKLTGKDVSIDSFINDVYAPENIKTYSDVFEELGWNPKGNAGKIAKGTAGTITDILADPIVLTTLGTKLLVGVSKGAAKAVTKKSLPKLLAAHVDDVIYSGGREAPKQLTGRPMKLLTEAIPHTVKDGEIIIGASKRMLELVPNFLELKPGTREYEKAIKVFLRDEKTRAEIIKKGKIMAKALISKNNSKTLISKNSSRTLKEKSYKTLQGKFDIKKGMTKKRLKNTKVDFYGNVPAKKAKKSWLDLF